MPSFTKHVRQRLKTDSPPRGSRAKETVSSQPAFVHEVSQGKGKAASPQADSHTGKRLVQSGAAPSLPPSRGGVHPCFQRALVRPPNRSTSHTSRPTAPGACARPRRPPARDGGAEEALPQRAAASAQAPRARRRRPSTRADKGWRLESTRRPDRRGEHTALPEGTDAGGRNPPRPDSERRPVPTRAPSSHDAGQWTAGTGPGEGPVRTAALPTAGEPGGGGPGRRAPSPRGAPRPGLSGRARGRPAGSSRPAPRRRPGPPAPHLPPAPALAGVSRTARRPRPHSPSPRDRREARTARPGPSPPPPAPALPPGRFHNGSASTVGRQTAPRPRRPARRRRLRPRAQPSGSPPGGAGSTCRLEEPPRPAPGAAAAAWSPSLSDRRRASGGQRKAGSARPIGAGCCPRRVQSAPPAARPRPSHPVPVPPEAGARGAAVGAARASGKRAPAATRPRPRSSSGWRPRRAAAGRPCPAFPCLAFPRCRRAGGTPACRVLEGRESEGPEGAGGPGGDPRVSHNHPGGLDGAAQTRGHQPNLRGHEGPIPLRESRHCAHATPPPLASPRPLPGPAPPTATPRHASAPGPASRVPGNRCCQPPADPISQNPRSPGDSKLRPSVGIGGSQPNQGSLKSQEWLCDD
ncbi:basic proline-rich protein-like [Equus przewalskii]|uniref:Basic proline-rich protein-like n=1 Tax=Equus przewalskii TaxID=9798 RepID=A0ABM4LW29_EQUPR